MTEKKINTKAAIGGYAAFIVAGTLVGVIPANLFAMAERFSADYALINMMFAIIGAGRISTLFLSGIFSDKYGSKATMLLSMLSIGLFYGGLPFLTSIYPVLALSFVAGMGFGMIDAAATKLIFDCFPIRTKFGIGMIQLFYCVGASIAPLVAGLLTTRGLYFGWFFWGVAALCALNLAYMASIRFPIHGVAQAETEAKQALNLKNPNMPNAAFAWGSLLFYTIGASTFFAWNGVFARDICGLSEPQAIQIAMFYNIGAVFAGYIISRLLERIHVKIFLLISPVSFGLALCYILLAKPGLSMYALFLVVGFLTGVTASYIIAIVGLLFPRNQGIASGITMSMQAAGQIITPILTAPIYARYGIHAVIITACAAFGICFLLSLRCKVAIGEE